MINALFLLLAFLTDVLLGIFFGGNFVGLGISATPNVLLIALILLNFKQNRINAFILSFFVGLSFDLFNINTLYTYAIIYLLTSIIVSLWSTRINDTFIELFLLTLSAVFVKEVLVYIFNIVFMGYILNIGSWAANHLTFTLLVSVIPIIVSVLIKLNLLENTLRKKRIIKKSDFINYRY